jgi:hypothetical protein
MLFGKGVHGGPGWLGGEESKRFFFEKKKQKTFANCGRWPGCCQRPQERKFFGYFFSKK